MGLDPRGVEGGGSVLWPGRARSVVAPVRSGVGVQQEREDQRQPLADTGWVSLGGRAQNQGQTDYSYPPFGTPWKQVSFCSENRIPIVDHSIELKSTGPISFSLFVVHTVSGDTMLLSLLGQHE